MQLDQDELAIIVVSRDSASIASDIKQSLDTLGVSTVRCFEPTELSFAHLSPHEIIVAEFNRLSPHECAAVSSLVQGHPLLGLISPNQFQSGQADALACSEVVVWPGNPVELETKLKRLHRQLVCGQRMEQRLALTANLVGQSPQFRKVLENISKYAKCDAPVLITGETGSGKEIIARAIHYLGVEDKLFVAVNCGAIPDSLVENELFGHVKGAYTDASQSQCGLVEQAKGGTLFLDEIEALSPKGQVALLRFLQDYEYRPLGSQTTRNASLRLIAATNESLESLVEQGCFRKDLFYRLNILPLHLPTLRERGDDVVLLAEYFVDKYRDVYQQFDRYLSPNTLEWMRRYDWPGNVRELENLILREFLLADSACISIPACEGNVGERRRGGYDRRYLHLYSRCFQDAKSVVVDEFERNYLKHVLDESNGNISEAARLAGKERRTFAKLLSKHGIVRQQFGLN